MHKQAVDTELLFMAAVEYSPTLSLLECKLLEKMSMLPYRIRFVYRIDIGYRLKVTLVHL